MLIQMSRSDNYHRRSIIWIYSNQTQWHQLDGLLSSWKCVKFDFGCEWTADQKKKKGPLFNEWNRKGRRKPVSSRTPKTTRQIMELEKLLIHGPLDGQRKGRDEKWANSGKKRGRIEEEDATRGANNCVLLYKSRLFEFGRPIVKNSSATYSERELQETCCV